MLIDNRKLFWDFHDQLMGEYKMQEKAKLNHLFREYIHLSNRKPLSPGISNPNFTHRFLLSIIKPIHPSTNVSHPQQLAHYVNSNWEHIISTSGLSKSVLND